MPEIVDKVASKTDEHEFFSSIPKGYRKGKTKYIVITGSVISGVGKGTFSSCLGNMLKMSFGFKIAPVKFDGYINCDAGTLNPYRHGEVFVLDDGTECDLDLGTYERMLNKNLTKHNYLTTGKIFKLIIEKERAGKYLGRDVQFIPHVTGEIKNFLRDLAMESDADIVMVEVGGTIGDIENSYFIEAMREMAYEEGDENVCFVNVAYILEPKSLGEHKSKAAQLGIKSLMSQGIQPDIVILRSRTPVPEKVREKVSIYSNVPVERVVNLHDLSDILSIPLKLKEMGMDQELFEILNLRKGGSNQELKDWTSLTEKIENTKKEITVGITGKYTSVHDAYISILKALEHTAPYFDSEVKVKWIETTGIKNSRDAEKALKGLHGVIVPGGFGSRGTEGKIRCIEYARKNDMPFLGLCYGFQLAVVEYARNVLGLEGANSTEIDKNTDHPVIDILPEQKNIKEMGGSMRLGGNKVMIKPDTIAYKLYKSNSVTERFRHRYEANPDYVRKLEGGGLIFSGTTPDKKIMQILELSGHPFFVASQFHPEFTSKPLKPNPLFRGFVEASLKPVVY